jgi:ribosome-associated toxin RatA of RatAB toxin-antitoxin module
LIALYNTGSTSQWPPGGTNVEYHVDLKFRSRLLQLVMEAAFADRAVATIAAYKGRAHRLYRDRT